METVTHQLARAFRKAIADAFAIDADPQVVPSQNEKLADYQSNVAMSLSKQVAEKTGQKTNPRAVAEQIKEKVQLGDLASELSLAGPGFINVRLNPAWLSKVLSEMESSPNLGVSQVETPATVVVDYSGPNIAKQMHVGHLRSTIIGDTLSRVLEFRGDEVIRRNHIGDWGTQFGMLIAYLLTKGGQTSLELAMERQMMLTPQEVEDEDESIISDLEVFYQSAKRLFDENEKFREFSRLLVVKLQAGEKTILGQWQDIVDETRAHYLPIYERLNVKLRREHEFGESFYNPLLPAVVKDLKGAGIAEESDGAVAVFIDGKEEGKTPLIIEKTGGGYLYGTTDLAAVRERINDLGATRLIYTHDSRQADHFRKVFATARKAGWAPEGKTSLEYAPFGTMLGKDGKPFKTRSGDTIKLKDLLDEAKERALVVVSEKNPDMPEDQKKRIAEAVGIGAVKYADLSKDRTSDYVFDWDKMLSFDGNTAPYLQYAYARIRSIFRKAEVAGYNPGSIDLQAPHEIALGKQLVRFGEVIETVARELKPHHLTTYLYDLATRFSGFFENCPVMQSEEPTRSSRLALCDLTAKTLAQGLDLLGIEHPEQM